MPTFSYKALQADGKVSEGVLEAAGRPDALRQMEALGLRPVNLAEKAASAKKGATSSGNLNISFGSK
jgi:type II secretory pathway component PulF